MATASLCNSFAAGTAGVVVVVVVWGGGGGGGLVGILGMGQHDDGKQQSNIHVERRITL